MSDRPLETARDVIRLAQALGFAGAGVCKADPSRYEPELRAWLDAGKHSPMSWLERNVDVRLDPARLLDGARSVVMVADLYATRADPPDRHRPGAGRIARYARGRDYHKRVKKRLHALADTLRQRSPDAGFRAFVDTAPALERELAARAGLGWTGKHTLTIHPRLGSYMVLGGVATTLALDPPPEQAPVPDHCGTCTRCIDACPTDAITPYSIDARRCISYLTIERRLPIDPAFHDRIGTWLFGCDICQEVCPHNSPRTDSDPQPRAPEDYAPIRDSFDLLDVLGWDEDDRRDAFRATALTRARLDMIKRNALIVAGNTLRSHDLPALRRRIAELGADPTETPLVRDTAATIAKAVDA